MTICDLSRETGFPDVISSFHCDSTLFKSPLFLKFRVLDLVLSHQQRRYRCWVKDLRYFWRNGKLRIIAFWFITTTTAVVSVIAVSLDFLKWDSMNKNLPSSNEVSRSFLASFIIVCDLVIIMQVRPHFLGTFRGR